LSIPQIFETIDPQRLSVPIRLQVRPLVLNALHADRIARPDIPRVLHAANRALLTRYFRLTGGGIGIWGAASGGQSAAGNQRRKDAQSADHGWSPPD
jgi:hypothetical protein